MRPAQAEAAVRSVQLERDAVVNKMDAMKQRSRHVKPRRTATATETALAHRAEAGKASWAGATATHAAADAATAGATAAADVRCASLRSAHKAALAAMDARP